MKYSEIKEHLGKFRVGIAGAGGLGSNCAMALARCGVGRLIICDNDIVEKTNLNRQYYFEKQAGKLKCEALKENIELACNDVIVEIHNILLDPENISSLFSDCDIIVEAVDNSETKEMIIKSVQETMPAIPLIIGSGVAGWDNTGNLRSRKIDDTLYVCGDEESEVSDDLPALAPRVSIVANMQADVVISLLLNIKR